ncbi:MAG: helix-turn-helix domain-containing protein [Gemmatimonadota bacterium]
MTPSIDLTRFGFTPTEGLVYEVLVRGGPGTGYAVARAAGLARANAYGALEGLVAKGAARVEAEQPKRYRPEPPSTVVARIIDAQGQALDVLNAALDALAVPTSPTLVELTSARGTIQLMSHEVARAEGRVELVAPPDAFGQLTPSLRKAAASGVELSLWSTGAVELPFTSVSLAQVPEGWPGEPLLLVVDGRGAIIGGRAGDGVVGHWGTVATFVAAARAVISQARASGGTS